AAAGLGRWLDEGAPSRGGHAVRVLELCSTFDTSDTRPATSSDARPGPSDTRPGDAEAVQDATDGERMPCGTDGANAPGRVPEGANVERDHGTASGGGRASDAGGASVGRRREWRWPSGKVLYREERPGEAEGHPSGAEAWRYVDEERWRWVERNGAAC